MLFHYFTAEIYISPQLASSLFKLSLEGELWTLTLKVLYSKPNSCVKVSLKRADPTLGRKVEQLEMLLKLRQLKGTVSNLEAFFDNLLIIFFPKNTWIYWIMNSGKYVSSYIWKIKTRMTRKECKFKFSKLLWPNFNLMFKMDIDILSPKILFHLLQISYPNILSRHVYSTCWAAQ